LLEVGVGRRDGDGLAVLVETFAIACTSGHGQGHGDHD
jgi:hypothetical protein